MKEIPCQFGKNERLSGIMTISEPSKFSLALVFLNAGLDSRSGPYRLHVQIARIMTQHGLDSFRFDYGDLGYSQPIKSDSPLRVRINKEIEEALNYIQSHFSINQFILLGLCSGAEDAFRYAKLDQRVKGIVMIDPFAYREPKDSLFFSLIHLYDWSARKLRAIKYHSFYQKEYSMLDAGLIDYQYMQKNESKGILSHLIQRNTRLHFIYTSGMKSRFSYKAQFWRMFPELKHYPHILLDYLPKIGHVQMLEEERTCLINLIEKKLVASLSSEPRSFSKKM